MHVHVVNSGCDSDDSGLTFELVAILQFYVLLWLQEDSKRFLHHCRKHCHENDG